MTAEAWRPTAHELVDTWGRMINERDFVIVTPSTEGDGRYYWALCRFTPTDVDMLDYSFGYPDADAACRAADRAAERAAGR